MTSRRVAPHRRIWSFLVEPRALTAIFCLIYLLVAAQGVATLLFPVVDVPQTVPRVMVDCLLILGGLLGFAATPRGMWLFERPAILMVGGAYLVHMTWVIGDFDGDNLIEWPKAIRLLIVCLFLSARYARIHQAMLDPTKP